MMERVRKAIFQHGADIHSVVYPSTVPEEPESRFWERWAESESQFTWANPSESAKVHLDGKG